MGPADLPTGKCRCNRCKCSAQHCKDTVKSHSVRVVSVQGMTIWGPCSAPVSSLILVQSHHSCILQQSTDPLMDFPHLLIELPLDPLSSTLCSQLCPVSLTKVAQL